MSVSSLTDIEEDALRQALESGPESGSDGEDSNLDSEDKLFESRLKDALAEAAVAEEQMSPEERDQYNAMVNVFLEREKQKLDENEENILQDLLIEEQERQKRIHSERLATTVRLNQLSKSRKAFANANGGKKRTIRKKNRKGTRTKTRQRKNRTRIHKKARKSMKRKTSRCHTFK